MKISIYFCATDRFLFVRNHFSSFITSCLVVKLTLLFYLDIDECRDQPGICQHGSCSNLAGTHICNCDSGYVRSSDGKRCEGKNVRKTSFYFVGRPSLGPPYFFCFNALRYLVGLAGVALLCSTVVMIACESIRFFRL